MEVAPDFDYHVQMADIVHLLAIKAPAERVFDAVSTPAGLDRWWSKRSTGEPKVGSEFFLHFGRGYDWQAVVTRCIPHTEFELKMTAAQTDWIGSRIGFRLKDTGGATEVSFYHTGWPDENEHYRISCYCWAMYLRLLRRYLEHGEEVEYERRLDV